MNQMKVSSSEKKAREQPSRKVLSDVDGCDLIDKIVVAHKGKVIPCWFPGTVKSMCPKGYVVEFFSNLGVHVCTRKNIMRYEEFCGKKKKSALYKAPSNLKERFDSAIVMANRQDAS